MPSLTNIITLLKFAAAAAVLGVIGWLWIQHGHDQKTIAGQSQLLAQADTQKNLDAATIAQLRTDIGSQSTLIGQLGERTAAAMKATQDAQVAVASANAKLDIEQQKLQAKHNDPAAATKTCHDAIEEWRARQ